MSQYSDEIVKLPANLPDRPCAGDVVRLVAPGWEWGMVNKESCYIGAIGMIGGETGKSRDHADITFRFSAHIDQYVSCSGGPGTIHTDMSKLRPTDEVILVEAWRWIDGRAARDNALHYRREARVWEWDGQ